ncbi:PREDICTED: U11/U12 small nuclear ribonucleoprotein 25 kDa protein [Camelina sativa]|uniref:U11/U12 small nuclear ribonucleoprotein 25 kDa protein n=1 Tax=Camelina sativa TaxID=90675 RepID=A0ABM0XI68_CAMSA|nr:PREDICTED: U11/U12 small nuclear ribonucleoprotein 25 kDa protein [Camelina sativa]XP_010486359.1 PREDICTED: U11/U12 small nuclear ribonucleoprotein 25 kDa protein [Camelina sativa]
MEKNGDSVVGDYDVKTKREKLKSVLSRLLADPILADVPRNPTLFDVVTLVSLEKGSAMRLSVIKLDGSSLDVAVMNSATLKDLKLLIKKKVNEMEQANMGHRHISWKHVWSNFCLSYNNEKLLDDNALLQDVGVRNNSQVTFMPYVMKKGRGRHSKRKKHRLFRSLHKTS